VFDTRHNDPQIPLSHRATPFERLLSVKAWSGAQLFPTYGQRKLAETNRRLIAKYILHNLIHETPEHCAGASDIAAQPQSIALLTLALAQPVA
jgi:hypothetical protein